MLIAACGVLLAGCCLSVNVICLLSASGCLFVACVLCAVPVCLLYNYMMLGVC